MCKDPRYDDVDMRVTLGCVFDLLASSVPLVFAYISNLLVTSFNQSASKPSLAFMSSSQSSLFALAFAVS